MLFLFVICFLVEPSQSIGDDKRFTVLKFGTTINDYVQFRNYDMSPFRNALTMCSWVRRAHTGSNNPIVLHYYTSSVYYEIKISSTGRYNRVVDSTVVDYIQSKFTTHVGKWLHYCVSWTTSTNTILVYLNGVQVASGQTRSSKHRQLRTPGTLTFGRVFPRTTTGYIFGGELFDLNMYTKVLSPAVISRMAARTVCGGAGEYEEDRYRVFRWEQLLEQSRSGAVMEIDMRDTCELGKQLAQQINITAGTQADLNQTREDLAAIKAQLNKVLADLNTAQQALKTVTSNLNRTEEEETEEDLKKKEEHELCTLKLEEARKFENISRFDVLFTSPYYNKIFTKKLLRQLKSSWNILSEFV